MFLGTQRETLLEFDPLPTALALFVALVLLFLTWNSFPDAVEGIRIGFDVLQLIEPYVLVRWCSRWEEMFNASLKQWYSD